MEFQPLPVPRDSDGYVKSFDILSFDTDEARDFFDRYGFIVFGNVFTSEQCAATISDIWDVIESSVEMPVRHDENLWIQNVWYRTGLVEEGIIGDASLWTKQIILNRQTANLHRAFATILRTDDLLVNHDRYGMFRPTKGHPERKTMTNLHLDMNPWNYIFDQDNSYQIEVLSSLRYESDDDWIDENNEVGCAIIGELHVQGLVNLADNREENGGFWLVPGFHKYLSRWTKENTEVKKKFGRHDQFILFDREDIPELYAVACHISTRAGSAILWDQRTMHGSRANQSQQARFAQFFKMFPREHESMNPEREQSRRQVVLSKLEKANINSDTDLTPLGKKVFGLVNFFPS